MRGLMVPCDIRLNLKATNRHIYRLILVVTLTQTPFVFYQFTIYNKFGQYLWANISYLQNREKYTFNGTLFSKRQFHFYKTCLFLSNWQELTLSIGIFLNSENRNVVSATTHTKH